MTKCSRADFVTWVDLAPRGWSGRPPACRVAAEATKPRFGRARAGGRVAVDGNVELHPVLVPSPVARGRGFVKSKRLRYVRTAAGSIFIERTWWYHLERLKSGGCPNTAWRRLAKTRAVSHSFLS